MALTRLIVGLGNPDEKYRYTRHNAGYLAIQQLAGQWNAKFRTDSSSRGLVAKSEQDGTCYLLLPLTYMNLSGVAISALAKKKISLLNIFWLSVTIWICRLASFGCAPPGVPAGTTDLNRSSNA